MVLYERPGTRTVTAAPIAARLAVGLTPHDGTLPDGLPVDAGMRWLVDFDAAVTAGMGLPHPAHARRNARPASTASWCSACAAASGMARRRRFAAFSTRTTTPTGWHSFRRARRPTTPRTPRRRTAARTPTTPSASRSSAGAPLTGDARSGRPGRRGAARHADSRRSTTCATPTAHGARQRPRHAHRAVAGDAGLLHGPDDGAPSFGPVVEAGAEYALAPRHSARRRCRRSAPATRRTACCRSPRSPPTRRRPSVGGRTRRRRWSTSSSDCWPVWLASVAGAPHIGASSDPDQDLTAGARHGCELDRLPRAAR